MAERGLEPSGPIEPNGQTRKRRGWLAIRQLASVFGFATIVVAIPLLTPALNGLKPSGMPLGYALVAHGIPLLLATWLSLTVWMSRDGQ